MAGFFVQPVMLATAALVFAVVAGSPALERDSNLQARTKRSDDTNPLLATVQNMAQQMTQMQAQLQANRHDIDAASGQMVGFTVRTKQQDMHGFGANQVVRFDDVIFNSGNGYNPATGVFTASLPGTYVFFLQALRHDTGDATIGLDVMKNGAFLTRAHAGYSKYENGSTLAVTHLNQGDTVRVQVSSGTMFWGGPYTTYSGFRISPK